MLLAVAAIILLFPQEVYAAEPRAVINEFVADGQTEWVELYISDIDFDTVKTYWVDDDTSFDDDSGNGKIKSLQNSQLTNSNFVVLEFSSFFNNTGDHVTLFDPEGTMRDSYEYRENPGKEVSIGRFPDGEGTYEVLAQSTKGSANSSAAAPTPTITPTLTPSLTPTKTPVPTKTPTPTKSPTPTRAPTTAVLSAESVSDSPSEPEEEHFTDKTFSSDEETFNSYERSDTLYRYDSDVEEENNSDQLAEMVSAQSSAHFSVRGILGTLSLICFAVAGFHAYRIRRDQQTPEDV